MTIFKKLEDEQEVRGFKVPSSPRLRHKGEDHQGFGKERELGKGGERAAARGSYFSRVFVRMNDDFSVEKQPFI